MLCLSLTVLQPVLSRASPDLVEGQQPQRKGWCVAVCEPPKRERARHKLAQTPPQGNFTERVRVLVSVREPVSKAPIQRGVQPHSYYDKTTPERTVRTSSPRGDATPDSPRDSAAIDAADETKTQTRNLVLVAELLHDRHVAPRPPRVQRDRSLKHGQLQPQEDDDVDVVAERHIRIHLPHRIM